MESPEPWFEDFGAAKLKRGRAVVKIDADFTKVIARDYHVFLTLPKHCSTNNPPSSEVIGVAALAHPDLVIEIVAIAALPDEAADSYS